MAKNKDTQFEHGANDTKDPLLKVEDIGSGVTLNLQGGGLETQSDYGVSLLLPVKLGNKKYAWFVRLDSKNYAALYKKFGDRLSQWKGEVDVTKAEHLGKTYIEVEGARTTGDKLRAPVSAFED